MNKEYSNSNTERLPPNIGARIWPSAFAGVSTYSTEELESLTRVLRSRCVGGVHIDAMDGTRGESRSWQVKDLLGLPRESMQAEFHVLTRDPMASALELGRWSTAARFVVPLESAVADPYGYKRLRNEVDRLGISLSPKDHIEDFLPFAASVNFLAVMGYMPGDPKGKLDPELFRRALILTDLRSANGWNFILKADGGVRLAEIRKFIALGFDELVIGRDYFEKYPIHNKES